MRHARTPKFQLSGLLSIPYTVVVCRRRSQARSFEFSGCAGCNARVENFVCFDSFQNKFLSKFLPKYLSKYATKAQGRFSCYFYILRSISDLV